MTNGNEYINSGILELYVLGCTTAEQTREVELMAAANPEIKKELSAIEEAMEAIAMSQAVTPDPVIKPFLLATIDYIERLKKGEPVTEPPLLHETSAIDDYHVWLERSDMIYRGEENIYAKIIGNTAKAITAIVWIKDQTPAETHHNEYEKFLIVEGSCNIIVEDTVHQLNPGDYFRIPLHKNHVVKITSNIPCKIILQREAA